mmetsp:Transcript_41738/g.87136  ORF Transcript_41738/g.87136 Transcript_41738/m.87136 type:complete len:82 (+) Transcript_41738:326-571(+)
MFPYSCNPFFIDCWHPFVLCSWIKLSTRIGGEKKKSITPFRLNNKFLVTWLLIIDENVFVTVSIRSIKFAKPCQSTLFDVI